MAICINPNQPEIYNTVRNAFMPTDERANKLARIRQTRNERGTTRAYVIGARPIFPTNLGSMNNQATTLALGEPVALNLKINIELAKMPMENILIVGKRDSRPACLGTDLTEGLLIQLGNIGTTALNISLLSPLSAINSRFDRLRTEQPSDAIDSLFGEYERRRSQTQTLPSERQEYICLTDLQKLTSITPDSDYPSAGSDSPNSKLLTLISRGGTFGIHIIVWADSLIAFRQTFGPNALALFKHRVAFGFGGDDLNEIMPTRAAPLTGQAWYYDSSRATQPKKFSPFRVG
jgi:hypothetical protein